MKSTPREVARKVLERVEGGSYATLALSGEMDRAALSPADRGLATELVYGVLRKRLYLDHALARHAPRGLGSLDPRTLDILRIGAYQLLFLRVPPRAAVHEAVGAVKRLRGEGLARFANALLRRLAESGAPEPPADPVERLAVLGSLPRALVEDALRRFSPEEAERFVLSLGEAAPLWLRLNPLRGPLSDGLAALAAEAPATGSEASTQGPAIIRSDRLPEAARVRGGGQALLGGAAFGQGWFTVQDLGAQLVARLLCAGGLPEGPILDACAGVGGKSTHLCALTADRVDIDAADRSPRKLELLGELCRRMRCGKVRPILADLTQGDAPLQPAYGAVLLDAPCSGLGVLRRHPEARWRPQPAIGELAALQGRLLAALCTRVKPGGVLVYSVCTYTDEEGPAQVARFLAAHPDFHVDPAPASDPIFAGLLDADLALRTWPHRDDADAFYAVRLRRRTTSALPDR
jgi:16S rRNA (cytosine967-C5)-methyltransferase